MASANITDKLIIFKGDDTGGVFGRRLAFTIEAGEGVDLSGCHAEWIFDGIVKTFDAPLIPGEVREVFYSHNETRCMALGVRYGTFRIIDAAGKVRTLTNTKPVEVTNDAARCYPGASDASFVVHGIGDMKHSEFADLEEKEGMTLKEVGSMVNTLIRKLKGSVAAFVALLSFGAFADGAITPQTDFGDISPTAKISTVISDAGAVMTESDPTVPAWAKQANPPQTMTTNAVDALANSAVVTNALTVATTNRVALLESSKADQSDFLDHRGDIENPHQVTAEQVEAYTTYEVDDLLAGKVSWVEDEGYSKTAVTIGSRKDGKKVGAHSLANGYDVTASEIGTHAAGAYTRASGIYSHAEGYRTVAAAPYSSAWGCYSLAGSFDKYSFVWNGDPTKTEDKPYNSRGLGTFCINPLGGINGFYIGEQTLHAILTNKADKSALNSHVENKSNPHSVTAAQVGALPLVEDKYGDKTAATIGSRNTSVDVGSNSLANGDGVLASGYYSHAEGSATTAAGDYSHAEGSVTTAAGDYSHAEGVDTTAAGDCSHAEGICAYTKEQDSYAFAWNGDWERLEMYDPYESHGEGTFNINPVGGLNGFYIGEQTLYAILTNKADRADISATNPTFSNAVLAVGLNIDTNSVAVLNDIAATFGGFPLGAGETATTVGGLLAALAAAIAWLKKNKVQTLKLEDGSVEKTAENGVAKLDNFFTNSNSLLTGTIDARLPYPLYAVPSTGLLKDRAINTTSLASVTVPESFTDLLVRASVASSLSVTMPESIATKYGDTFPGEAGEYLITITKTGAAEAYVRTIKLEEVANA